MNENQESIDIVVASLASNVQTLITNKDISENARWKMLEILLNEIQKIYKLRKLDELQKIAKLLNPEHELSGLKIQEALKQIDDEYDGKIQIIKDLTARQKWELMAKAYPDEKVGKILDKPLDELTNELLRVAKWEKRDTKKNGHEGRENDNKVSKGDTYIINTKGQDNE